ncbi:hypothetical protein M011DRAFT_465040 [Sporormia fimetaria CBS 119925]|uniref:Uncharacterized protein n=1 Tax=Sporormia fimetaria CBS 119925 TaxID=1340428 RepID=A0A6A6VL33_9PLEO|nr:hypothetical protein M011DRAFT_465040 [Sporormia fimetaria CBS 119925]
MEEKRRVESEQIQKVLDGLAAREAAAEAEAEEQRRKHALDQERVAEDEKKASEKASSSSSTPTSSEATSEPDNGIHSVEAPAANTPDATTGTPAISTDSSASQRPTSSPPTSPSRKRKSSSSSASSRSSKRVRFTPEVEALPETRKSRLRSWVHTPAASDDDDSLATETIVRAETETVEVATKAVTVVEGNVEVKTEAQGSSVPSVEQVTVAEASDSQAVTTETSSVVSEEGEERVLEDYEEESGSEAVGEQHPQVEFDAPSPPAFPPPPESPAISSDGEPMSPPDLSDSGDQDEQEDLDPEAELTKPLPKMHGFGTSEDINTKGSQASEFNSEAGSRRSSVSYGSLFGDEDEGVECESARDTSSEGEEEPQTPGSSHERVEGKEMTGVKVQVHEVEDEVDFGGGDEEEEE